MTSLLWYIDHRVVNCMVAVKLVWVAGWWYDVFLLGGVGCYMFVDGVLQRAIDRDCGCGMVVAPGPAMIYKIL